MIYATSIAGEPNVAGLPLVEYRTGNTAGETAVAIVGDRTLYAYNYVLPAPFAAAAGTQYWVEIVGFQSGIPNWEIADGMNGNGTHFWANVTYAGGYSYHWGSGDAAFILLGPLAPTNTPTSTPTSTRTPTPTPVARYRYLPLMLRHRTRN